MVCELVRKNIEDGKYTKEHILMVFDMAERNINELFKQKMISLILFVLVLIELWIILGGR